MSVSFSDNVELREFVSDKKPINLGPTIQEPDSFYGFGQPLSTHQKLSFEQLKEESKITTHKILNTLDYTIFRSSTLAEVKSQWFRLLMTHHLSGELNDTIVAIEERARKILFRARHSEMSPFRYITTLKKALYPTLAGGSHVDGHLDSTARKLTSLTPQKILMDPETFRYFASFDKHDTSLLDLDNKNITKRVHEYKTDLWPEGELRNVSVCDIPSRLGPLWIKFLTEIMCDEDFHATLEAHIDQLMEKYSKKNLS